MIQIAQAPLDHGALLAAFSADRTETGAIVSFTGLTRGGSGDVGLLTLQAYPGFTETVMRDIEAEARERFDVQDVLAVHRWGPIEIGEPIVFVAVAAAHRRAAFGAADYLMDQFKTRAPFWKREDGPGGARWIEPRDSDYVDQARWTSKETEIET